MNSLLAGDMRLLHRCRYAPPPFPVEIAEPAVAVALQIAGSVFLPQQQLRHAAPLQLLVHLHPIDGLARSRCRRARLVEHPSFQRRVVYLLRRRPSDPEHRGAADVLPRCRLVTDAGAVPDLPITSNPPCASAEASRALCALTIAPSSSPTSSAEGGSGRVVRLSTGSRLRPSSTVVRDHRNCCPRSFGILSVMRWNPHPGRW